MFVYDAAGKEIAEYSTIVASIVDARVAYLTADHLGSPRINTDRDGNVTARHDYRPFGEEIFTEGGRTSALGYEDDSVRRKFTGYERDGETGLDFAQARMYANSLGRFSTADPVFLNKDRPFDPQRFNMYVYVRNTPMVFSDPTGKDLTFELSFKQNSKKASNLSDARKYVKAVEKASGLALSLNEATGQITVKSAPKSVSATGTRIQTIIGDSSASVKIAVSNNDKNVLGGQYDHNGHQTIDLADEKKLSKKGGFTTESAVIHETVEAYQGLKNGDNQKAAHLVGIDAENEVRAAQGLDPRAPPPEKIISVDSNKNTTTFQTDFGSHVENITVTGIGGGISGDIMKTEVKKKP